MIERAAYQFGEFVLDVAQRRLTCGARPIALAPKAFDLLTALVEHAGRLVTKRELLDLVWPDAPVEEGILGVHVSALRKALGADEGGTRYIETVSRSGYRFAAPVARRPAEHGFSMRWPIGVLPARPDVHELVGRARLHLMTAATAD